jgi:hypothetical protein
MQRHHAVPVNETGKMLSLLALAHKASGSMTSPASLTTDGFGANKLYPIKNMLECWLLTTSTISSICMSI